MRLLFLCSSPYQILVACCILKNCYSDCKADIIVADHMTDYEQLADRIKEKDLFENIYTAKIKEYDEFWSGLSKAGKVINLISRNKIESTIKIDNKYDVFLCTNTDGFQIMFYAYLKRYNNHNIKAGLFEDGLALYSFGEKFLKSNNNYIKGKIKKIFGLNMISEQIKEIYVFRPECMSWSPNVTVKKIPNINKDDKAFISSLNEIFGYNDMKDDYNKKIIYFESGILDWKDSYEVQLLNIFSEYVSKEDIMVKIHPRDYDNRFKDKGYCTNNNRYVPWEIISLNRDFDNTILVTVASVSVITPYVLFGKKVNAIILDKLYGSHECTDNYNYLKEYLEEYYYSRYPDMFFEPKTIDELKNYLEKYYN